jgi:hypothetical protein
LPALDEISPAKLAANRENAKLSTGAKSPETRAISAQNHTIHGLARHQNGNFKILTSEDATAFEKLSESLIAEHSPQTPTESILVNTMAQSTLARRTRSASPRPPASTPIPEPSPTKRNSPYICVIKPRTPAPSTNASTTC